MDTVTNICIHMFNQINASFYMKKLKELQYKEMYMIKKLKLRERNMRDNQSTTCVYYNYI